jgi:cardiolipin synthase
MDFLFTHLSIVIGFVLAFLLAIRIVREQRPTGSTFAWLLAILLIPYVGVPLYILFGGRKLARLAGAKEPLYETDLDPHRGSQLNDTQRILMKSGAPFPTFGNRITWLPDGETAYRELMALVHNARETIDITTFILGRDSVGQAFVDELCRKVAAGVQVRLLVDALGSLHTRGRFLSGLRQAGGKVGIFMPMLPLHRRWSANLRNHRKLIVCDGKRAYIGGMNLGCEYMGPEPDPKRWSDFGVLLEGPVVRNLHCIFGSDWEFATREKLPPSPAGENLPSGDKDSGVLQVVASGPDVKSDSFYHGLLTAMAEAKSRIWILTPYFIPDGVIQEILTLAARLGRDVRILVPQRSNHFLADLARSSFIRDLTDAGVKFFGYRPGMIHTKMAIIDHSLGITGSANMDLRSLYLNYELGLFLHSRADIDQMAAYAEKLFAQSEPIPLSPDSGVRSWLEDASRLVAPLL